MPTCKKIFLFFLIACGITGAAAAQENFKENIDYVRLVPAQPVQNPDKIEVIEFFWYGCPHCYHFEPEVQKWLKTLPPNVQFIRQPAIFSKPWAAHARAYYIAETLGIIEQVHADLFDTIQKKHQALQTQEELAAFFIAHGVTQEAFEAAYSSFTVDTKMRLASTITGRYGITGVPTVVINGKYKTDGTLAKNFRNMIAVMNYLIAQESAQPQQ